MTQHQIIDAKWKINKETLIQEFYDLARSNRYTSGEVSEELHKKYVCIPKSSLKEQCIKYRQDRYTKLEERVSDLISSVESETITITNSKDKITLWLDSMPVGMIHPFASPNPPNDCWFPCDGSIVQETSENKDFFTVAGVKGSYKTPNFWPKSNTPGVLNLYHYMKVK